MESLFYQYNPWWEGSYKSNLIKRDNVLSKIIPLLDNASIVFLTGLRRIGKTASMRLLIDYLINEKKQKPSTIFYISMDDYLLQKLSIHEIVDEYRKMHKIRANEKVYLFLDEITFKEKYELELKNLYDKGYCKIYASSSSASLLKSKKHFLTGRHTILELLPLDFNEYLLFKDITIKKSDKHLEESYFTDYLQTGGIPEYVLRKDIAYLHDLVDDIICKDIAGIHNIKNIQQLREYFLLLMERSGKIISINKIAAILKISPDTSRRYFDLFCDTYLIHPVNRYGKTNEQILAPKKIYAGDIGIRNIFTGYRDKGCVFENYIYLNLKQYNPFYIYQNTNELDFYIKNRALIEVKYHNEELSINQQKLFDDFVSPHKAIIRNNNDLQLLSKHLKTQNNKVSA